MNIYEFSNWNYFKSPAKRSFLEFKKVEIVHKKMTIVKASNANNGTNQTEH